MKEEEKSGPRILHVCTSVSGGAGIAAIRLHQALLESGVDSSFIHLNHQKQQSLNVFIFDGEVKNALQPPLYPLLTLSNYIKERFFYTYSKKYEEYKKEFKKNAKNEKMVFEDLKNFKMELFSSPSSPYDITETKKYKEADIIHLHWVAGFLDYASFFAKNKKPIVWTLHDENPYRGGFHYLEDEIRNKDKYEVLDGEYKKEKIKGLKNQEKLTVVSPSKWIRKSAEESEMFNNRRVINIRYSLDTNLFTVRDKKFSKEYFNIPSNLNVLLFVAQSVNNKRKGFDLLLPLINSEQFSDTYFLIIGENDKSVERTNVKFLGTINDERLMPLVYSAADLFVLPSREDNLPNTMLESLCCGTPVIAFDIGDNEEVISKNKFGVLSKEVTSSGLGNAISNGLKTVNDFDNNKISTAAKLMFAPKKQAELYVDEYRYLLNL